MNYFKKFFLSDSDRKETESLSKRLGELESKGPEIKEKTLAIDGDIFDLQEDSRRATMINDYEKKKEIALELRNKGKERDEIKGVWEREIDSIRNILERLTAPVIYSLCDRLEVLMVEAYQAIILTKIKEYRRLQDRGSFGEKDITMIVCKTNRDAVEEVANMLRGGQRKLRGMGHQSITLIESEAENIIQSIPGTLEEKEFEIGQSEFREWEQNITNLKKEVGESYRGRTGRV